MLRSNPKNVTAQAAMAMNTNARGISCSSAIPTASVSRNANDDVAKPKTNVRY